MCPVLIIEDDPLIATLVEAVLEQEGATSVQVAITEADAVSAAFAQPPALIVSDVKLKAGTGPSAVATIRAALGPIPVIFTTGVTESIADGAPCTITLAKPFTQKQLTRAYGELMLPAANPAELSAGAVSEPQTALS